MSLLNQVSLYIYIERIIKSRGTTQVATVVPRRKMLWRLILSISFSTLRARVARATYSRPLEAGSRGSNSSRRSRERAIKRTLARETCARVPPVSLSLLQLSSISLCVSLQHFLSLGAANRAQTSLTVAVATAAAQPPRYMSLRLCATSTLRSSLRSRAYLPPSLVVLLSPSLIMHTASHEQLSTSPRTRLLPCAHYVINTFTSLALSERDDANSRRPSDRVRVPAHIVALEISVVSFAIVA